jgi:RNA polymerase sigma-70 factor (ECF subfamily)
VDATREAAIELSCETQASDLETVFREQYPRIARAIARIIRDPGRAEELAVEVFLRFSTRSSATPGAEAGWLFRTAVRLALDELRRQNLNSKLQSCLHLFKRPLNPEELQLERDRQARVGRVLSHMPRRDAELLILRAEGMAYDELAKSLAVSPASIGTLLSRAQKAFRKEYVKRYGNPE